MRRERVGILKAERSQAQRYCLYTATETLHTTHTTHTDNHGMSGYTKLFSSILASSIWSESDATRIVWITMLAMADRNGRVSASLVGLAHQARKTVEETEAALKVLSEPDKYSKNPANEGRRIEALPDGGWKILNYSFYRNGLSDDEETAKARERMRRWRQKSKAQDAGKGKEETASENSNSNSDVTSRNTGVGVGVGAAAGAGAEKKQKDSVALPFDSQEFKQSWNGFLEHRRRLRKPMTDRAQGLALKKLPHDNEAEAIRWIDNAVEKGWQGIFEPTPDARDTKAALRKQGQDAVAKWCHVKHIDINNDGR